MQKKTYHVWFPNLKPKIWVFPKTNLWGKSPKPVKLWTFGFPSRRLQDLWELWWAATVMRNGCTMRLDIA